VSDLAAELGATDLRRVQGGDLNDAYRATFPDRTVAFVKTAADAEPGRYATEAAGLAWLAAADGGPPVPRVLQVDERFLVLEWIEPGPAGPQAAEELGRGLAALHAAGAEAFGGGPPGPLRLGAVQLPNDPHDTWAAFYAECRLRPLAARLGLDVVSRVADRIDVLAGPPEPPARLHGDLWSGNVTHDRAGRPWLVDPSAHGGHREVDLAMLQLFGGPGEHCLAAYDEAFPFADGWRERVGLWQLLPLLVHAVLFGGGYADRAMAVARGYL
jgi:fructosamine-3-kinase